MKNTVKALLMALLAGTMAACSGSAGASDSAKPADSSAADTSAAADASAVSKEDLKDPIITVNNYLESKGFSKSGLIDQMVYDGYSELQADKAIKDVGVDWNEQAKRVAESYLKVQDYSEEELTDLLKNEGFTDEEAASGAKAVQE